MDTLIKPAYRLSGNISVGGDKSISHRSLLLGAIADGTTEITGLSTSADVHSTEKCLKDLGVVIRRQEGATRVNGVGLNGLRAPLSPLDAGNSGTTIRPVSYTHLRAHET